MWFLNDKIKLSLIKVFGSVLLSLDNREVYYDSFESKGFYLD